MCVRERERESARARVQVHTHDISIYGSVCCVYSIDNFIIDKVIFNKVVHSVIKLIRDIRYLTYMNCDYLLSLIVTCLRCKCDSIGIMGLK